MFALKKTNYRHGRCWSPWSTWGTSPDFPPSLPTSESPESVRDSLPYPQTYFPATIHRQGIANDHSYILLVTCKIHHQRAIPRGSKVLLFSCYRIPTVPWDRFSSWVLVWGRSGDNPYSAHARALRPVEIYRILPWYRTTLPYPHCMDYGKGKVASTLIFTIDDGVAIGINYSSQPHPTVISQSTVTAP